MTTPAHTPGPWGYTTVGSCHGIHPAASENERDDICRITPHNFHPDGWVAAKSEAVANARLIAAAPALLAALQALVGEADLGEIDYEDDTRELLDAARAAIAKATEGAA
jgi:hypothetical protein